MTPSFRALPPGFFISPGRIITAYAIYTPFEGSSRTLTDDTAQRFGTGFLKRELEEWAAIGITTLSSRLTGNEITAYAQLDRQGELPIRLAYTHEIARWNALFVRDIKRMGNLQGHGTDYFWMIGLSVGVPDCCPGGQGGSTGGSVCSDLEKLEILPEDFFGPGGMCYWDQPGEPSRETVLMANRMGYRVAGVHTFGDKGLEIMLDTFAKASQEKSVLGRRFALDHGMMVSPAVIEKSVELDVIWSMQGPMFLREQNRGGRQNLWRRVWSSMGSADKEHD